MYHVKSMTVWALCYQHFSRKRKSDREGLKGQKRESLTMEQKMMMVIRTVENPSSLLCHGPGNPIVDGEVPDG